MSQRWPGQPVVVAASEVTTHRLQLTRRKQNNLVSWPRSPPLLPVEPEEPCSCRGEQPGGGERSVHLPGRGGAAGRQRAPDGGSLQLRGPGGGPRAAAGLVQGPPSLFGPPPSHGPGRCAYATAPSAHSRTHSASMAFYHAAWCQSQCGRARAPCFACKHVHTPQWCGCALAR